MKVFVIDISNDDRGQLLAELIKNCDARPQVEVVSESGRAAKTPDGDLAFVHFSDRRSVPLESVELLIFYSGGGGSSIQGSVNHDFSGRGFCIIDPLTCDHLPESSKLNEVIIWARCRVKGSEDCGGLPTLLSAEASQQHQDCEADLIRLRVLAWIMKDNQRIRRLGCDGLKALVEHCRVAPKIELREVNKLSGDLKFAIQGSCNLETEEEVRKLRTLAEELESQIRALPPSTSSQSMVPKAVRG